MTNPSVIERVAERLREWATLNDEARADLAAHLIATLAAEVENARACKRVGAVRAVVDSRQEGVQDMAIVEYEGSITRTDALLAEVKRG